MVRTHLVPLIIAGPTGSGKSALAMQLALRHQGEIICADSRQFYAGMAIGTACPSDEEMRTIPHHGYGIIDPAVTKIDAGFFVHFAQMKINEVQKRYQRPILVGGTGLYLRSLYYGLQDVPKSNKDLAERLSKRCDEEGLLSLFRELKQVDEDAAKAISSSDRYRILRALEIYYSTGHKPSLLRQSFKQKQPQLTAHWVYKKPDKSLLMNKLKTRVEDMFNAGLIEEAKELRKKLPDKHWVFKMMGYQEALAFLDKKLSLEEAKEKTLIRHRQYAKRQYTWFNKENFYRWFIFS